MNAEDLNSDLEPDFEFEVVFDGTPEEYVDSILSDCDEEYSDALKAGYQACVEAEFGMREDHGPARMRKAVMNITTGGQVSSCTLKRGNMKSGTARWKRKGLRGVES